MLILEMHDTSYIFHFSALIPSLHILLFSIEQTFQGDYTNRLFDQLLIKSDIHIKFFQMSLKLWDVFEVSEALSNIPVSSQKFLLNREESCFLYTQVYLSENLVSFIYLKCQFLLGYLE